MRNITAIALTLVAALALGACSKKNSGGLRARANTAVATNNAKEGNKTYLAADEAIDQSIEKLHSLGYKSIGRGTLGTISTKVLFGNVKPEDRNEVKRLLNKILTDGESQLKIADKFDKSPEQEKRKRTESIMANAQTALDQIAKEEQEEKK